MILHAPLIIQCKTRTYAPPLPQRSLHPRLPPLLYPLLKLPPIPIVIPQRPRIRDALPPTPDPIAPRQTPHHPTDLVLRRELPQAPLQHVAEQRLVLRGAEFGQDDGRLAHGRGAVLRDVARGGRGEAEGVEAGLVELGFDEGAGARVEVLRHGVEVEFVDYLLGPGVRGKVED